MASAKFVQTGDSIDYTPGSPVEAGDVVVQNDLVGVAKLDIAADALGALAVAGVFDMPKDTGSATAIEAGKTVYWDDGNEIITESSSGNTYAGKTIRAAGVDDDTVRVKLDQ